MRALRKRVRTLEQEREISKKARGLLREGKRDPVRCLRFIAAERVCFPISLMWRLLGVSRSGFHAWARRSKVMRRKELACRLRPLGHKWVKSVRNGEPIAVRKRCGNGNGPAVGDMIGFLSLKARDEVPAVEPD